LTLQINCNATVNFALIVTAKSDRQIVARTTESLRAIKPNATAIENWLVSSNSPKNISGYSLAAGFIAFELFQAIGTDAVGKVGLGVLGEVGFHLLPVTLVVPNPFAGRTNRQQPA
jgi:hypothetical protein